MLRRLLDSPRTYYVLAGLLIVGALISQLEIRGPTRPAARAGNLTAAYLVTTPLIRPISSCQREKERNSTSRYSQIVRVGDTRKGARHE